MKIRLRHCRIFFAIILAVFGRTAFAAVGPCSIAGQTQFDGGLLEFCDGSTWNSMKGVLVGSCNVPGQTMVSNSDFTYCDGVNSWSMKGPNIGSCPISGQVVWTGSTPAVCISGTAYSTNTNVTLIQSAYQAAYGHAPTSSEQSDFLTLMSQASFGYQDLFTALQSGNLPGSLAASDGLSSALVLAVAEGLASCQPAGEWSNCTANPAPISPATAPATLGLGEPLVDDALGSLGSSLVTNFTGPQYIVNISSDQQAAAMKNLQLELNQVIALKPKVFRLWIDASMALTDPQTVDPTLSPLFLYAITTLHNNGIKVLGMTATYPGWMSGNTTQWDGIPCPSNASLYQAFLKNYKTSMGTLAATFPVDFWEVGNETIALAPIQSKDGYGSCGQGMDSFSIDQKAQVTVDLMYQAHAAIKHVNPTAIVVMPPMAPQDATGNFDGTFASMAYFLNQMYSDIQKGTKNPRDYFDWASWHPYFLQEPGQAWIDANNRVYAVMMNNNDGSTPAIFSEMGFTTTQAGGAANNGKWLKEAIQLSQQNFYWLKAIYWFRAYFDSQGGSATSGYGILPDPAVVVNSSSYNTQLNATSPQTAAFCALSFCQQSPPAGVFKALVGGIGVNTWGLFYNNGVGFYCKYSSPSSFNSLIKQNYNSVISSSSTQILDPNLYGINYVGLCQ
jgi:hypothetical protein